MPSQQALDAFVAMVLANKHDEAIATFYTPDSTMQENLDPPRKGRDANVARERAVMARATQIHSALEGPIFVSGDRVVLRWIFRFDFADGTSIVMDEIAYQRWEGDLIAEERFYYDPAQRTRKEQRP
ncbi:MAG TPA: nuclear transport factor 2 family protein [Kofleriaceae bacterium]|nr:nuclear transport factor 2 family protein [Kofleriaceae bacterium]